MKLNMSESAILFVAILPLFEFSVESIVMFKTINFNYTQRYDKKLRIRDLILEQLFLQKHPPSV